MSSRWGGGGGGTAVLMREVGTGVQMGGQSCEAERSGHRVDGCKMEMKGLGE